MCTKENQQQTPKDNFKKKNTNLTPITPSTSPSKKKYTGSPLNLHLEKSPAYNIKEDILEDLKLEINELKNKEREQAIKNAELKVEVAQLKIRIEEKDKTIAWYQNFVGKKMVLPSSGKYIEEEEEQPIAKEEPQKPKSKEGVKKKKRESETPVTPATTGRPTRNRKQPQVVYQS